MPRTTQEIIDQAEQLAKQFMNSDPGTSDRHQAESLAAVHRAALSRAEAEAALANAVVSARTDGHTWATIGKLVGTTGEAARQRYGHRPLAA